MKWAEIISDKLKVRKPDPVSYRLFKSKKLILQQSTIWAKYEFKDLLSDEVKERYKMFCGGYLQYYDTITRNGAIDHFIFFDWDDTKNADGYYCLTINIGYDGMPKNSNINGTTRYLDPKAQVLRAPSATLTKDPPPPPPPPPPSKT